ncbi:MAG: hypothetical protein H6831_15695 [Planctomycetes bacterium]|nr:hypothetical protein [Planctomycetota bacterium]MCB9905842.1 hypothetical protein [Planctomycetota bacterium]
MLAPLKLFVPFAAISALAAPSAPAATGGDFVRRPVVYVCDSSTDAIWRLVDFDGDGLMSSDGEATIYYDDVAGSLLLGNPCALALTPGGVLYVNDSTQDQVIRLEDLNGDGDANDPGEHTIFFDGSSGTNAAGLLLTSSFAMDLDAAGRLWLTNSDGGAGSSPDCIFWIEDLNADGDAQDAGESAIYYYTPTSGALGDSAPSALRWGQDGRLYYVENGYSGYQPAGIYALDDANGDGFIDPLLEVSPFYLPPDHPSAGAYYVLAQDEQGNWLFPDLLNRILWRLKDGNGDGVIVHEWEADPFWSPAQSQVWGIDLDDERGIYLAESANPDRILRLEDADWNGVIGAGEALELYSDVAASANIAAPRAIVVGDLWMPGSVVCDGGPGAACPCANFGQAGTGCANSTGEGAELAGFGETQVASDNYLLLVRFLPALEAGVFLQGAGLAGFPFRDGLLCVASPTVRLETVAADAGGTARSTVAIAAAGAVQPGDLRYYQFWYRDPGGACGTGSNFSNGWAVDWE